MQDACGRITLQRVLVDEICGAEGEASDLAALQTTMFRDGAVVDQVLYAVDATHTWSLDISDPASPRRVNLQVGPGQPLAMVKHGAEDLLVAGGVSGLWGMRASRGGLEQTFHVPLEGAALDVSYDEERGVALVAAGEGGLSVVPVDEPAPEVSLHVPVQGQATGVSHGGGVIFVTNCLGLVAVDAQTQALLGELSLNWSRWPRLRAPTRDVVVVQDVVFVAAGRYGVVAVDVADPSQMEVLGNCTLPEEPGFYASGVRVQGDDLFVAAGEWGILHLDVSDPRQACPTTETPEVGPDGAPWSTSEEEGGTTGETCNTDPTVEVGAWRETWERPWSTTPEWGRDPIQVLPHGELLFAFGDARRLATRAVLVRSANEELEPLGRYDTPLRALGVAAHEGRLLVFGPEGGLFRRNEQGDWRREEQRFPEMIIAGGFTPQGRWVAASQSGLLFLEGAEAPLELGVEVWPGSLAIGPQEVVVGSSTQGLVRVDHQSGERLPNVELGRSALLPLAVIFDQGELVCASPEWDYSLRWAEQGRAVPQAHGVFGAAEGTMESLWRVGVPRRLLASSVYGLVDVVMLGQRAGLRLHGEQRKELELPPGEYLQAVTTETGVVLVKDEPELYRGLLIWVDLSQGEPAVVQVESFPGSARGAALEQGVLYVADADRGVRLYRTQEERGALSWEEDIWLEFLPLEQEVAP